MRKVFLIPVLAVFLVLLPLSARAGWFSPSPSCDFMPDEPRPEWVDKGYDTAGNYAGIGLAERNGMSVEEMKTSSWNNAVSDLMKKIEVLMSSKEEEHTSETGSGKKDARFRHEVKVDIKVRVEMVIHDLKLKSSWLDRKNCMLYTMVTVSRESVEQARKEELSKARLVRMKELIAQGVDREKNRNVRARKLNLSDAGVLLERVDFTIVHDDLTKDAYARKINEALADVDREMGQAKGRIAVAALEHDPVIPAVVVGRILDHVKEASRTTDRLMGACSGADECIRRAAEEGFSAIAVLKVSSHIETTSMGALKGTLTASITVYDTESRKVVRGPDIESAQMIGWSMDELNWGVAVEKIIQSSRISAEK